MATTVRKQQEQLRTQANVQQRAERLAAGRRSNTPMSDAQISAVVATMNRQGVRYVIIGGVASQLHEAPVERTYAIDVVPDRAGRDLDALALALEEMNARLWIGPDEPSGLAMVFDRISLGESQRFLNLITDHGPPRHHLHARRHAGIPRPPSFRGDHQGWGRRGSRGCP